MAYIDLTVPQKASLDAFMSLHRPSMGQLSRLLKTFQTMQDGYNGGVSAILGSLANADTIDSPSGLAGTGVMTKADLAAQLADIGAILTAYNTVAKRAAYIQAAGLPNVV